MPWTQKGEGQNLRSSCSNSGLRPGSGLRRNLRFPSQLQVQYWQTEAPTTPQHCCPDRDARHKAAAAGSQGRGQGRGGVGRHLHPTLRETWKTQGEDDREAEWVPTPPGEACLCGPQHMGRLCGAVRVPEDRTRPQRPSKETGSLADTGPHKWTPCSFLEKGWLRET